MVNLEEEICLGGNKKVLNIYMYVLFVVNGVLLSGVFCLLVFYIVWLYNDYKDDF